MKPKQVISLGAGRQSSFLLIQALEGKFDFYPDLAVFADTQNEPDYVYRNLDKLIAECEKRFNFSITVVTAGSIYDDTIAYLENRRKSSVSLPLFIGNPLSQIKRQCTDYYKIRPVRQAIRRAFGKVKTDLHIGISLDEVERIKESSVAYITNRYPLVVNKISLIDIHDHYKRKNLKSPAKSSCKICPFHSNNFWRWLKANEPRGFRETCLFDEKIRDLKNLNGKAYLHRSLRPLSRVDLSLNYNLFPELIEECNGYCGL